MTEEMIDLAMDLMFDVLKERGVLRHMDEEDAYEMKAEMREVLDRVAS